MAANDVPLSVRASVATIHTTVLEDPQTGRTEVVAMLQFTNLPNAPLPLVTGTGTCPSTNQPVHIWQPVATTATHQRMHCPTRLTTRHTTHTDPDMPVSTGASHAVPMCQHTVTAQQKHTNAGSHCCSPDSPLGSYTCTQACHDMTCRAVSHHWQPLLLRPTLLATHTPDGSTDSALQGRPCRAKAMRATPACCGPC